MLYSLARDYAVDTLDCGDGADTAYIRPEDRTTSCEEVVVAVRSADTESDSTD